MNPWWQSFLFAMAVSSVALGGLCWQLWRKRNDEEAKQAGSRYFEDKIRSEMQPAKSEGMTVADLIHVLGQHDPDATVVLWDQAPLKGSLAKLGAGEVQPIQLGARESNGLLLFEPWVDDDKTLQGPFPGVTLGSS